MDWVLDKSRFGGTRYGFLIIVAGPSPDMHRHGDAMRPNYRRRPNSDNGGTVSPNHRHPGPASPFFQSFPGPIALSVLEYTDTVYSLQIFWSCGE